MYDGSCGPATCICGDPANKINYRPAGTPWDSLEHNANWTFVGDAGGPVIYGEDEGGHYMTSVNLSEIPRSNSLDPDVFGGYQPPPACWTGPYQINNHEPPKLGGGDFGNWQDLTYSHLDPLGYSGLLGHDASSATLGVDNWIEWDITDLVKDWIDNGNNYGMLIKYRDEDWNPAAPNNEWMSEFWSSEGNPNFTPEVVIVPEPATMAMLGLGGVGMLLRRRRQKK